MREGERSQAAQLMQSDLVPLLSCLTRERHGMIRFLLVMFDVHPSNQYLRTFFLTLHRPLLEVITNGVVETVHDIARYIRCTLFAKQRFVLFPQCGRSHALCTVLIILL